MRRLVKKFACPCQETPQFPIIVFVLPFSPRSDGHRRYLLGAAAALLLVFALAGCAQFIAAPFGFQTDVIGNVAVSENFCSDGFGNVTPQGTNNAAAECNASPHSVTLPTGASSTGQMLVGLLVPVGSTPPNTFTANLSPAGTTVNFTSSPEYATQLATLQGTPTGQMWVGYISDVITEAGNVDPNANGPQAVTFDAVFGLPPQVNGQPFVGPFH